MDYESLLQLVQQRRSIRQFTPDPVPGAYIDHIIEAARWAPSGANSQPWQFVLITHRETQDKIVAFVSDYQQMMSKIEVAREPDLRFIAAPSGWVQAPVFILVLGDPRTKEQYPLAATLERGQDIFISSLANAFLYMTLAVTTLGLGGQWVSFTATAYVQSLLKDLLGIPRGMVIYDMLAVGYPALEPTPRMLRAKETLMHYERYDRSRYSTDEEVKAYIAAGNRAKEVV